MKLILNIYYHGEVMHVKVYRGVISNSGVVALCLNFNYFFSPQP